MIVALGRARAAGAWTSSSAAAARTACRGCGGWTAAELREVEPHAAGIAALHSPATAIFDFAAVARALAADVRAAGGDGRAGTAVRGSAGRRRRVCARRAARSRRASPSSARARWSDRLARPRGAAAGSAHRAVPRRLPAARAASAATLVRGLIYPVPDPRLPFLGVHLTRRSAARC